jgi:hypothetical protein
MQRILGKGRGKSRKVARAVFIPNFLKLRLFAKIQQVFSNSPHQNPFSA